MLETEKELKRLRQTCLQFAHENATLETQVAELKKSLDEELARFTSLFEQTTALVALGNVQAEQLQKAKAEIEQLKGDDMADELNAAEADRYEAHALGEIAQFVETVREMRAAQVAYFRTRDKDIMRKSMALEKQVDDAIKKDDYVLWALQYLPKQA